MSDVCPKCGAEVDRQLETRAFYKCHSTSLESGFRQSPGCRIRELTAKNERLREENGVLRGENAEADAWLAACVLGLEWDGDGYSWNPKEGDYRERPTDAMQRHADKILKENERLKRELEALASPSGGR